MKSYRMFTLLEVMIAVALLLLSTVAIGWKMEKRIAQKRFQTDLSRIQLLLKACSRLAINTRADWRVVFDLSDERLLIQATCAGGDSLISFQPKGLSLEPLKMFFDKIETEQFVLFLSPTGKVAPEGILEFSHPTRDFQQIFSLPDLLFGPEGNPIHPNQS